MDDNLKNTNPKDAIGCTKLPMHLWPETATAFGCLGLLDVALKYGRSNWREAGVRASIYYDACRRHLNAWFEGEDNDPDSGLPHLSHALACLAIIVDAKVAGKLKDDRMFPVFYRQMVSDLTPHVKRLMELHKDKNPKHWTISDANGSGQIFSKEDMDANSDNRRRELLEIFKLGAKVGYEHGPGDNVVESAFNKICGGED